MTTLTAPPWAHHLAAALEQLGYEPGKPAHVTAETLGVDARSCARRRCGRCRRRGLDFLPYHRGRSYKVVASCPDCLNTEEV